MNEDDNIIQVRSMSIIMLIFISDIFTLYMSDEGFFTFIIINKCLFQPSITFQ